MLIHDQSLRSTTHPVDNDEDPAKDLDGDGWITQMRVPDDGGDWAPHPDDNRIQVRDPRGSCADPRYSTMREGIDNDIGGAINEDGVGGRPCGVGDLL